MRILVEICEIAREAWEYMMSLVMTPYKSKGDNPCHQQIEALQSGAKEMLGIA